MKGPSSGRSHLRPCGFSPMATRNCSLARVVMAGLGPAIHGFLYSRITRRGWPAFAGHDGRGKAALATTLRAAALVIALLAPGASALAQSTPMMPGMPMGAAPSPDEAASTKAYRDAMAKMNRGMAITYSGDADKDFVAGMIAHHQGAIGPLLVDAGGSISL